MGLLDWFGGSNAQQQRMDNPGTGNSQPGGVYNPDTYGILGPQGRQPLDDEQKRSILFSAIADSFDSVRGIKSDTTGDLSKQFAKDNAKQQDDKRRSAVNQAIQTAYAQSQKTGDYTPVRQALMAADAAGEDVSHITQHLQFGQPKIQDVGGAGYSVDPFSGRATKIIDGKPENPLMNGGLMSPDHGKTWAPIPGYVDQQRQIAGARRKPPAATAGMAPKPWQRFGGQ